MDVSQLGWSADAEGQASAQQIVEKFLALEVFNPPNGLFEEIEVVWVKESTEPDGPPIPAICLTWSQGPNLFGLVSSIDRLAEQVGNVESIPFYLRLAIDEPHWPAPDGRRLWFTNHPTFTTY